MKNAVQDALYSKIQTDESLMENVYRGDAGFPFYYYYENIRQFDFNRIDWHWHDDFEFVYVEKGYLDTFIGSEKVRVNAGEALFINSKRLHSFHSAEDTILPNFLFPPVLLSPSDGLIYQKYIQPIVASGLKYIVFTEKTYWHKKAISYIRQIMSINDTNRDISDTTSYVDSLTIPSDCREMTTLSLLLQLWILIFDKCGFENIEIEGNHQISSQARLEIMMQYIHSNYQNHMTLDDISASADISKSSALNLFNNTLHITPVTYLIEYRLKAAAGLLRSTNLSISSIADDTGFDSAGYFCRKFKQVYKMSPSEYRNQENSL